jgi:hypothetical protein
MPIFLLIVGILLGVVGLFLIGFSIPIRDFSLGSTLILAGAISFVGGLILIGLSAVVRELRKLANTVEKSGSTVRPVPVANSTRPPAASNPARPIPRPAVVGAARSQRAEPRFEVPMPDSPPAEPPPPKAPTAGEMGAERPPRAGLFASIRGRAPVPPPPPSADHDHPLPGNDPVDEIAFERDHQPMPDTQPAPRSPSLSALAARTAARLDLPRPVPDLPRAGPERPSSEPPKFERPVERVPEKPPRNMFDTVWPTDGKPPTERSSDYERNSPTEATPERSEDTGPAAEPRPVEILKSGVIDGMAYTLYTDGSIEAQLPQGTLRFTSIDDLRAHLEQSN